MDIKKQYFEIMKEKIAGISSQYDAIENIAKILKGVMDEGGVVQIMGVEHGQEFSSELVYRAGGLVPFHGIRKDDLTLRSLATVEEATDGSFWQDASHADQFWDIYKMDDRDSVIVISAKGNEPLAVEVAKRYHEKGRPVIAVTNVKTSSKQEGPSILDYADASLDLMADDPDTVLNIGGHPVIQVGSTLGNIIAQMLEAEIYKAYVEAGEPAAVLLSSNVSGADVHNRQLTDVYEGRVR